MISNSASVSIILPCYNPPSDWTETVTTGYAFLKRQIPDGELIVVNDGSTKNFTEAEEALLTTLGIKCITYPNNKGKGYALRKGVEAAKGDSIIYTDIDFPYTHESFIKIYEAIKAGSDTAIGIRGQAYYAHLPKSRVYISKFLRSLIRFFLRIPTDDTQCGLKGFNQKGKALFLKTTINRYLFDLEFVFLSAREKLNIKTVEVELRPEVVLSKMNWKVLLQEFGNFLKIFVKSMNN